MGKFVDYRKNTFEKIHPGTFFSVSDSPNRVYQKINSKFGEEITNAIGYELHLNGDMSFIFESFYFTPESEVKIVHVDFTLY